MENEIKTISLNDFFTSLWSQLTSVEGESEILNDLKQPLLDMLENVNNNLDRIDVEKMKQIQVSIAEMSEDGTVKAANYNIAPATQDEMQAAFETCTLRYLTSLNHFIVMLALINGCTKEEETNEL